MAQPSKSESSAAALAAVAEALEELDKGLLLPEFSQPADNEKAGHGQAAASETTSANTSSSNLGDAKTRDDSKVGSFDSALRDAQHAPQQETGLPSSEADRLNAKQAGLEKSVLAEPEPLPRLPTAIGLEDIRLTRPQTTPNPYDTVDQIRMRNEALQDPRRPDNNGQYDANAAYSKAGNQAKGRPAQNTDTPANDDRGKFAHIMNAVQPKSSRAPYILAVIATLVWIELCISYYMSLMPEFTLATLFSWSTWAQPQFALGLVVMMCPVLFVFAAAILVRRANELRVSARSIAEVALHLVEPETTAAERVTTLSNAIQRELNTMGDGVERALTRASEIEALINREISNLERVYFDNERRMRLLVEELIHERESINVNADRVRSVLIGTQDDFAKDMATATEKLVFGLEDAGKSIKSQFGAMEQDLTQSLSKIVETTNHTLGSVGLELGGKLVKHNSQLAEQLTILNERTISSLDHISTSLVDTMASKSDGISADLAKFSAKFEETAHNTTARLEAFVAEQSKLVESHFETLGETVSKRLSDERKTASEAFHQASDAFIALLNDREAALEAGFEDRAKQIGAQLLERAQKASQQFADAAENLHAKFSEKIAETVTSVEFQATHVSDTIAERISQFEDVALTQSARLGDAITGHSNDLVSQVDEVERSLTSANQAMNTLLQSQNRTMLESIKAEASLLTSDLSERLTRIHSVLTEQGPALDAALDNRYKTLSQSLVGDIDAYGKQMTDSAQSVSASLKSLLEQIHDGLDSRAKALNENLARRTLDIAQLLGESNRDSLRALEIKASEVTGAIDTQVENFENKVVTRIEGAVDRFAGNTRALQGIVEQHVESIDNSSALLNVTTDHLREGVSDILSVLSQTVSSLRALIDEAGNSFGLVEHGLGGRIKEAETVIEKLALQIKAVDQTSALTLNDANVLAERISNQAQSLTDAVSELSRNQETIDEALETRRQSLDLIVTGFGEKTKTFEEIMQNFTAMMQESFDQALAKAHDIGTYVATNAEDTSQHIENQYNKIREKSEAERSRTLEALQAIYDNANHQMKELLGNALTRFKESAGDISGMTANVAQDIEVTRQELRRAIAELPMETAEQANAMRRIVADQIKALNELTDIVARTGRAYDYAVPANAASPSVLPNKRSDDRRNDRRQDGYGQDYNVGSNFAQNQSPIYPAQTNSIPANPLASNTMPSRGAAPYQAPMPKSANPQMTAPNFMAERAPVDRGATNQRVAARAPNLGQPTAASSSSQPVSPAAQNGWLRDLLTRASEPQDAPSARPNARATAPNASNGQARPFDTLSLEMARHIDTYALMDAWDRYKYGERYVFTPALYGPQGQQIFEDVRQRYYADGDFRQTADSYMASFEASLVEASQHDRNGEDSSRSFLMSDTGKLYTLIAHAAGKLG